MSYSGVGDRRTGVVPAHEVTAFERLGEPGMLPERLAGLHAEVTTLVEDLPRLEPELYGAGWDPEQNRDHLLMLIADHFGPVADTIQGREISVSGRSYGQRIDSIKEALFSPTEDKALDATKADILLLLIEHRLFEARSIHDVDYVRHYFLSNILNSMQYGTANQAAQLRHHLLGINAYGSAVESSYVESDEGVAVHIGLVKESVERAQEVGRQQLEERHTREFRESVRHDKNDLAVTREELQTVFDMPEGEPSAESIALIVAHGKLGALRMAMNSVAAEAGLITQDVNDYAGRQPSGQAMWHAEHGFSTLEKGYEPMVYGGNFYQDQVNARAKIHATESYQLRLGKVTNLVTASINGLLAELQVGDTAADDIIQFLFEGAHVLSVGQFETSLADLSGHITSIEGVGSTDPADLVALRAIFYRQKAELAKQYQIKNQTPQQVAGISPWAEPDPSELEVLSNWQFAAESPITFGEMSDAIDYFERGRIPGNKKQSFYDAIHGLIETISGKIRGEQDPYGSHAQNLAGVHDEAIKQAVKNLSLALVAAKVPNLRGEPRDEALLSGV